VAKQADSVTAPFPMRHHKQHLLLSTGMTARSN
jgi:hypothetical protein